MTTLVYTPGISIVIESHREGLIDVSDDISSGSLSLRENASHSLSFRLENAMSKYDGVFAPNDRISVQLKRFRWLQTFTGYLDRVPYFQAWPRAVQLQATCTSKVLRYWPWDRGSAKAYQIIHGDRSQEDRRGPDGGMAKTVQRILTEVVRWPEERIHIGRVPTEWVERFQDVYKAISTDQTDLQALLGTNPILSGMAMAGTGLSTSTMSDPANVADSVLENMTFSPADVDVAMATIRQMESGNNYTAQNRHASASGAYQVVDGTWGNYGGYARAYQAPPAVQDQWARERIMGVYEQYGPKLMNIPRWWYLPSSLSNPSKLDIPGPQLGPGNTLSVRQYSYKWGKVYVAKFQEKYGTATTPGTSATSAAPATAANNPTTVTPTTDSSGSPKTAATFLRYALAQAGDQYRTAAGRDTTVQNPTAFDCSGLVYWAAVQSGFPATWPGQSGSWALSYTQYMICKREGTLLSVQDALNTAGALLFRSGGNWSSDIGPLGRGRDTGHVAISLGNGHTIEAMSPEYGVRVGRITSNGAARFEYGGWLPGMTFTGPITGLPTGNNGNQLTGSATGGGFRGSTSGTVTPIGNIGGVGGTGDLLNFGGADIQAAMFNAIAYWEGNWNQERSRVSDILGGVKALMNDEPVMETIVPLIKAAGRSWCTAPNGDFIAWFPDYWGEYGIAGALELNTIELVDFGMEWIDSPLETHVYVEGAFRPSNMGPLPSGVMHALQQFQTQGIATVTLPNFLEKVINMPSNPDSLDFMRDPNKLLKRFGARVHRGREPNIYGPQQEFWFAVQRFLRSWAMQFVGTPQMTFMPELFPGMLLKIPEFGVQFYVSEVTHTWDLTTSGAMSFNTSANVMAPSALDGSGFYLLPRGGHVFQRGGSTPRGAV